VKIILAEKTGFCFGVKRAVAMAETALDKKGPIHSLGSIIHNKQVVEGLLHKGLAAVKDINDIKEGTVVISSHGISPRVAHEIRSRGVKIIDTTCPFVLNAQKIAKNLNDEGYKVIIVGDARHPEVKALLDFAPNKTFVVKNKEEARSLRLGHGERLSVISQTTQSMANFLDVVKVVADTAPKEIRVFNTICKDAEDRQDQAKVIARQVDLMLVIGGKDSANTKRLYEVCRKILKNSHLIETEDDLQAGWFMTCRKVGITSGASTPDWVVERVVAKINEKFKMKNVK